jgi:hypothetical protein
MVKAVTAELASASEADAPSAPPKSVLARLSPVVRADSTAAWHAIRTMTATTAKFLGAASTTDPRERSDALAGAATVEEDERGMLGRAPKRVAADSGSRGQMLKWVLEGRGMASLEDTGSRKMKKPDVSSWK